MIVAVSGGVDSMVLLDQLKEKSIIVAHVNYGIRKNAVLETQLVIDYCVKHHIRYEVLYAPKIMVGNFQNEARKIRYQFFKQLCYKYQKDTVAVAHHLDDHLETYLLQLQRGSIPQYYGIKQQTTVLGCNVLRPLLHLRKREIMEYALNHHIPYLDDESNFELKYQRNKIRQQLKSKSISEINQLIEEINQKNQVVQDPFYDLRRLLFKHHVYHVSNKQLATIQLFLDKGKGTFKLSDQLELYTDKTILPVINDFSYTLNTLNLTQFNEFKIEKFKGKGCLIREKDFPITIRNFKSGDKIKMHYGTKKVARYLKDMKIPLYQRKSWPVVVNRDGELIYVKGIGASQATFTDNDYVFVVK